MVKKYDLRWRFTYSDGKNDKVGVWGVPGSHANMAHYASKQNLRNAIVEGRRVGTHTVEVLTSILGQDFENFQWVGSTVIPWEIMGGRSKFSPVIVGANLVSRYAVITVFNNGIIHTRKRTEEEKKIIFTGTGV